MRGILVVVFALHLFRCVAAQECSKYHYEEQILAKVVRLEHRLEILEGKDNREDKGCKDCVQCPDGWMQYKGSCYVFVDKKLSFDNARANCKTLNADLVHIENADENTFIGNHGRSFKDSDFWIGLTDAETEGVFKWVDDNSRASFTDWWPGQPDNSGKEHCAHIVLRLNMEWNDRKCGDHTNYICEKKIAHFK
ncbi:perlucin-like protein [Ruditapes philippinarum]|uniref:perlucin-like protein n=1 Tax=Ruditapes philippinarum TaxID=129788 RepID=UPI00295ACADD|nr:perlucin-like protein [Ruditapes philippinarum]